MKTKFIFSIFAILLFSPVILAASPGAFDSGFGVAGLVTTDIFGSELIRDLKFLPDGRLVIVGRNSSDDFVVVRYTANGALDPSFSGDGVRNINFGASDFTSKVCLQNDNKIVVFGFNPLGSIEVARLNTDGSNDLSFSDDGLNIYPFTGVPILDCNIQSDGKILFITETSTFRLNSNGSLDSTFGTNGRLTTTIPGSNFYTQGVIIQPDGKIILYGNRFPFTESVIVRYNPNGSLDTTFSGDGIAVFNFAAGDEFLSSSALQSSGKIVLGVSQAVDTNGVNIVKVARLLPNGALDVSFGSSGVTNIDLSGNFTDIVGEVFVESDESILLALNRQTGSLNHTIANLDAVSGILTTKYGPNGFSPFITVSGEVFYSKLEDKLVIGNSFNDFLIRRLNLSKTPILSSDFDGDGATDTAVFRPGGGNWFILNSSDNSFASFTFGLNGDVPIDGDFDGDGKTDLAVFRPSNGLWSIQKSSDNSVLVTSFGNTTDKPVAADYDKDGKSDIAVFRSGTGEWLSLTSASNFTTLSVSNFGQNGDIPIPADTK